MLFISCLDDKKAVEMYNPIINIYQVVAVDRSNDDVNDFRIMFSMRNGDDYEWFFDTMKDRDEEYKRVEQILLSIT